MNIEIPDTLLAKINQSPKEFKEFVALCLYEKGLATMRLSAQIAEMSLNEFMELMAEKGVPNTSDMEMSRQNDTIDDLIEGGHFDHLTNKNREGEDK